MADILSMLRLRNIFGPEIGTGMGTPPFVPGEINMPDMNTPNRDPFGNVSFGAQPVQAPMAPSPQPDFDIMGRMKELYSPESMASDRYNELIGQMPRRQDYDPSIWRGLGAGVMSLASSFGPRGQINFNPAGYKMGQDFYEQPFTDKLSDWKNQIQPAYNAAQLERYNNANERSMAYQTVNQERLQRKQDEDAKIRQQRADIYAIKSSRPDVKFNFGGPTVIATDSTGKVWDTGMPTGQLTETDKINLQTEGRIRGIEASGSQARQTEETKQENRTELGWGNIEMIDDPDNPGSQLAVQTNKATGEVRPVKINGKTIRKVVKPGTEGKGNTDLSPAEQKTSRYNAATELKYNDPELGKFINLEPGSNFTIAESKPGGMFFGGSGPTPEQRAKIMNKIFGTPLPVTAPPTNAPGPTGQGSPSRGSLMGAPSPQAPSRQGGPPQNNAKRQQAIDILTKAKKRTSEANIEYVMKQLK